MIVHPLRRKLWLSTAFAGLVAAMPAFAAPTLVTELQIQNGTDLSTPIQGDPTSNRAGGLFSDLYYDRFTDTYYGIGDRGPGGGVLSYETRVQQFKIDVDPNSGAIANFNLVRTIKFADGAGTAFNGLNPSLIPGNGSSKSSLGNSFDPEGFVVGKTGNFFVSDEYGPTVREFNANGELVRTFTPPANLIPRVISPLPSPGTNTVNFVDGRNTANLGTTPANGVTHGRQDNRGFEGLTISPDGTKLYAVLQDPLQNEGAANNSAGPDGRRSRNVRIVEYDVATGTPGRQFIYQLEDRADINARTNGGGDNDFSATQQGRNIGLSSIIAINENEFLVLERDNRGLGVDPAVLNLDVGSKRVFRIDITGATDVSEVTLTGTNGLMGKDASNNDVAISPVSKSLFLDIQEALELAGLDIPEKIEGITVGPQLANGDWSFLIGTDNDFSVTQNGSGTQFDVCFNFTTKQHTGEVALGAACPDGSTLIPSYLYSFVIPEDESFGNRTFSAAFVQQVRVPEPGALALLSPALLGLFALRRRKA